MNSLKLSLRMLARDLRAGGLRVLLIALLVAVASVATVGFFTDRVREALNNEATSLLGGDLALVSDQSIPQKIIEEATRLNLKTATTVTFPSMVNANLEVVLGEMKAVSDLYPLRGRLRTSMAVEAPDVERANVPSPGRVWVSDKLLVKLNVKVGDAIHIGLKQFVIDAILTKEPDNAFDYFNVAPRILMNAADLTDTGLLRTGSRARYRLLVAGDDQAITAFQRFAKDNMTRGQRVEGVRDARSEVRAALDRAEQFLGLASLLSVILAAVGVALAARRFMQREMDTCAILRCLGASQATLLRLYITEFLLLGIAAGLLGCVIGFGAQFALVALLSGLVHVQLPMPTMAPAWQAFLVGVLLLGGFALPPLFRLKSVPTLRVLRRELGVEPTSLTAYVVGFAIIAALLYWKAGDVKIWGMVMAGVSACLIVSALLGWLMINLLGRLRGVSGLTFRYGLASLRRRKVSSIGQIVALGLGIMALLLLTLVRGDLMNAWRNNLPSDAPNRFVVNIQPDQLADVRRFFASHKLHTPDIYPMIRGRLTAINGKAVDLNSFQDERSKRLAEREFNLSFSEKPSSDNLLVAGEWWKSNVQGPGEFSVEEGIAQRLSIRVGDTLTYSIAGIPIAGKVSNLRKVDWDSFKVNFFVIASPGLLDQLPASYITSFYLPRNQESTVNELVRAFPNLTVIDVGVILDQVRSIADQVSRAVEFVFAFTLVAGLIVLYAAIVSSQDERIYEAAVMRTLGARRKQLLLTQLAEFAAIGLLAGVIAAAFASAVGYGVSVRVLNLPYELNVWVPLIGVILGAAGVVGAGLMATRATLNRPPLQTIRGLA
ncbi:MAG TPA: FtsX-like permease family protein [Burkholderiales bacterium]|nr:FtsX-like permease family protein [Burkholderiales bacterium]